MGCSLGNLTLLVLVLTHILDVVLAGGEGGIVALISFFRGLEGLIQRCSRDIPGSIFKSNTWQYFED